MKKILYIAIMITLLSSCVQNQLDNNHIEEGLPARIKLKFDNAEMVTKGIISSQEKAIYRLFLYSFYPSGELMARTKITDVNEEIVVDVYSGNNIQIYAVANYPEGGDIETSLGNITNLGELQNLQIAVEPEAESIEQPKSLMIVGHNTTNIVSGEDNIVTIPMVFLCAKITLSIADNTTSQDVRFLGIDIARVPTKSFIIEKGTVAGGNAVDAVDPTIANSTDYFSFNDRLFWERVLVMSNKTTVTETVYLLENRRGGRKSGVTKPDSMTEEEFNGYRGKTLCAPDSATYVKAYFQYVNSIDGKDYEVVMNFFLGGNNSNDYNIQRGHHYKYTITIEQGYNMTLEMTKDSNIDAVTIPFMVQTSSSMMMDAHPSERVVVLTASSNNISNVSIEILDDNMRTYNDPGFNAQWAKISVYDALRWQVSQNATTGGSTVWQQPTTMGYLYVRGKYIPHKSRREWLNANGHTYTLPEGITLGDASSDYPYDDDVLPYSKADRRMCYKLTDYPFTAEGNELITMVYADEFEYNISTDHSRRAYLKLTYTNSSNEVKTSLLNIIQEQPLYVGGVVTAFYPSSTDVTTSSTYKGMTIETIEEPSLWINPLFNINLQNTKKMRWGHLNHFRYNDNSANNAHQTTSYDKYRDGYYLTANIVYDDVTRDANYNCTWSGTGEHFRPKYGSGVNYTINDNGIREGIVAEGRTNNMTKYGNGQTPGNSGAPYYLPIHDESNVDIYNPMFNSSAAQFCHEKNKDLDGDGILSPWETVWYLPSQHELYQIWISLEALSNTATEYSTESYLSSSEYSSTIAYYMGFQTGFMSGDDKPKTLKNVAFFVRCARRIPDASSSSSIVVEQDGKPYIDCSSFPSHAYTTKSKGSATGKIETDKISESGATVFKRFRVAVADVSSTTQNWSWSVGYSNPYTGNYPADDKLKTPAGTLKNVNPQNYYMNNAPANAETGCNGYYENSDQSDKGQWRLPNKRELLLIWIYHSVLEKVSGFTPLTENYYWSSSKRASNSAHSVHFSHGVANNQQTLAIARCIKEDYSVSQFFLEFVFNGGVNGPESIYHYGYESFTLPTTIPTHPEGMTFQCWATNSDGSGTTYQPGDSFTMPTHRVSLYAIWN